MTFEEMEKISEYESGGGSPSPWHYALVGVLLAVFTVATLFFCGCMGGKASHQNGMVLYVDVTGRLGLGYGETEDMPGGCIYYRDVWQTSPAFWGGGTTVVHTTTFWDTTGMITNSYPYPIYRYSPILIRLPADGADGACTNCIIRLPTFREPETDGEAKPPPVETTADF